MSCSPSYSFRPTVRPSPSQSSAPAFTEHRSRLFAGGTFFRSIRQGNDRNNLSLEAIVTPATITLNVRFSSAIEEVFVVPQVFVPLPSPGVCIGGIAALRSAVNAGSTLIEMPARGFDFFDTGTDPINNCLISFSDTSMTGGSGPPIVGIQSFLDSVFTGTERTMIVINTTEDVTGFPVTPPTSRRVQQWNGTQWSIYSNLVQGACPVDGGPVSIG